MIPIDIDKAIEEVTDFADDSFESEGERQKELTTRLKIDTTSPFSLPHLVRPIIALSLLGMQIGIIVAIYVGVTVPTDIVIQVGSLLGIAIGFYFNSRKAEKINAKKVQAAIEIQELKVKAEIRQEKEESKQSKKQAKRDRRNN